jgi:hypothetical protein
MGGASISWVFWIKKDTWLVVDQGMLCDCEYTKGQAELGVYKVET